MVERPRAPYVRRVRFRATRVIDKPRPPAGALLNPTSDRGQEAKGQGERSALYDLLVDAHDLLERVCRLHDDVRRLADETSAADSAPHRRRAFRAWVGLGPAVAACRATLPMVEFLKGELQRGGGPKELPPDVARDPRGSSFHEG